MYSTLLRALCCWMNSYILIYTNIAFDGRVQLLSKLVGEYQSSSSRPSVDWLIKVALTLDNNLLVVTVQFHPYTI